MSIFGRVCVQVWLRAVSNLHWSGSAQDKLSSMWL